MTDNAIERHARTRGTLARLGAFGIDSKIDVGGMGTVWKGHHVHSGLEVAIKVAHSVWEGEGERMFLQEVEAVAQLDHPNVVRVFDYGIVPPLGGELLRPGAPYLVMEYASRGTLSDLRLPIDWSDLKEIAGAILSGLAHAHARGVIHRDLKPDNILLGSSEDPRPGLKLADFGVAYAVGRHAPFLPDASPHGQTEDAVGTPTYMAPEQFLGYWRDYGPWTDIYAVGVLLWEILCGRAPFVARTPIEIGAMHINQPLPEFRPTVPVPDGLDGWFATMLHKRPQSRFQWATDALQALYALDSRTPAPRRAVPRFPARYAPEEATRLLSGVGLGTFALRPTPPVAAARAERAVSDVVARAACGLGPAGLLVRGPDAVGKTHVVRHVVTDAAERGLTSWIRVDGRRGWGLGALLRAVVERFRGVGLPSADLKLRVWEYCQTLDVSVEDVTAILGAIDAAAGRADATPNPAQLHQALVHLVGQLAAERPLTVWIDDADASPALCWWARRLLDSTDEACTRVSLICTASTEEGQAFLLDALGRHERLADVALEPLSDLDMRALLAGKLELSPPLIDQVVAHSRGLPGIAIAMVQTWLDDGLLHHSEQGFVLADPSFDSGEAVASLQTERWPWITRELDCANATTRLDLGSRNLLRRPATVPLGSTDS